MNVDKEAKMAKRGYINKIEMTYVWMNKITD